MRRPESQGGMGSQAVIHLGMHGTVEWLPGQPLGNDRQSWSDELLGTLPNIYVYAANNPSESILAKRRGYGTLISYNVPPYGRAGLYLELANLKDLVAEYRGAEVTDEASGKSTRTDLRNAIWGSCQRCEILNDVPLLMAPGDKSSAFSEPDLDSSISDEIFDDWILHVADYLVELQDRLFSSGLHTLGSPPNDEDLASYLNAYFGEKLSSDELNSVIIDWHRQSEEQKKGKNWLDAFTSWLGSFATEFGPAAEANTPQIDTDEHESIRTEATDIVSLLRRNTEELDSVVTALDGGYVPPKPGGDLLRDGTSVLPTGKNMHALDREC